MKITISGATGLIGKKPVRELSERGEEVVVLTRTANSAGKILPL